MSLRGAGGGAIGAFIASVCCVIPILILIAGLNVAAGLTVSQYRPFFLFLGVLFVAFYILVNLHSRVQISTSSFREIFVRERGFVLTASGTFLGIFAAINVLIIPLLIGIVGADAAILVNERPISGVELKISGMTCPSCADVIEEVLIKKAGVLRAEVSYEEGKAAVLFNPDKISVDEIIETIKPYKAEVISEWEVNK